jgi:hypothetical protein
MTMYVMLRKGVTYFFHFCHKLGPVFDIGYLGLFKQIFILDTYLWPVIARHFPTNEYLFQDDNAPVDASRETKWWKQENNIKCMT